VEERKNVHITKQCSDNDDKLVVITKIIGTYNLGDDDSNSSSNSSNSNIIYSLRQRK
jgi:hypothetical protein